MRHERTPEDIDVAAPVDEIGLDSLTGWKLRNGSVTATAYGDRGKMVFDHPTQAELGAHLLAAELERSTAPIRGGGTDSRWTLEGRLVGGSRRSRRLSTARLRDVLAEWCKPPQQEYGPK